MQRGRLLDHDPDLALGLSPGESHRAHRELVVELLDLPPGAWEPDEVWSGGGAPHAMLVLEGLIAREEHISGQPCRLLLPVGTPILPPLSAATGLLPVSVSWTVVQPARIALLGDRWLRAVALWPQLSVQLALRAGLLAERLATHQAISQLPRVGDRIVALLLHLAPEHGRVTPNGILLELALTHAELGRLVGAKRPTVSLALRELAEAGLLTHGSAGWVLSQDAAPHLTQEILAKRERTRHTRRGVRSTALIVSRYEQARTAFERQRGEQPEAIARAEAARKKNAVVRERAERVRARGVTPTDAR